MDRSELKQVVSALVEVGPRAGPGDVRLEAGLELFWEPSGFPGSLHRHFGLGYGRRLGRPA